MQKIRLTHSSASVQMALYHLLDAYSLAGLDISTKKTENFQQHCVHQDELEPSSRTLKSPGGNAESVSYASPHS